MVDNIFKKITCKRCGAEILLKYLGEGESSGGFERWNIWEDKEKYGWIYVHDGKKSEAVCDKCAAEYNAIMEKFWNKAVEQI